MTQVYPFTVKLMEEGERTISPNPNGFLPLQTITLDTTGEKTGKVGKQKNGENGCRKIKAQ